MNGPNDGYKNGYNGGNYRLGQDLDDYYKGREAARQAADALEQFRNASQATNIPVNYSPGIRAPGARRPPVESPAWLVRVATALGVLAALSMGLFAYQTSNVAQPLLVAAIAAGVAYAVVKYGILVLYEFARMATQALAILIPLTFFIQWLTGYPLGTLLIDCLKAIYQGFVPQ